MKRHVILQLAAALAAAVFAPHAPAAPATISVRADQPGHAISPLLWGIAILLGLITFVAFQPALAGAMAEQNQTILTDNVVELLETSAARPKNRISSNKERQSSV